MSQVDLNRPVTHITQMDENYCWACAFAMILDRHSWAAALEIADRCPLRTRNRDIGSLLDTAAAARSLGLTAVYPASFSPTALEQRLRHSAVGIFGRYNTGGAAFNHVMVVTLLRGDLGDLTSLTVGVDDPYGPGTPWIGPWNQWVGPKLLRVDWLVSR